MTSNDAEFLNISQTPSEFARQAHGAKLEVRGIWVIGIDL